MKNWASNANPHNKPRAIYKKQISLKMINITSISFNKEPLKTYVIATFLN